MKPVGILLVKIVSVGRLLSCFWRVAMRPPPGRQVDDVLDGQKRVLILGVLPSEWWSVSILKSVSVPGHHR